MLHARSDYDRIQDPEGLIGADEPVFIVRAKDKAFVNTLLAWAIEHQRLGGDSAMSAAVREHATKGVAWQQANGCKVADAPEGTLKKLGDDE